MNRIFGFFISVLFAVIAFVVGFGNEAEAISESAADSMNVASFASARSNDVTTFDANAHRQSPLLGGDVGGRDVRVAALRLLRKWIPEKPNRWKPPRDYFTQPRDGNRGSEPDSSLDTILFDRAERAIDKAERICDALGYSNVINECASEILSEQQINECGNAEAKNACLSFKILEREGIYFSPHHSFPLPVLDFEPNDREIKRLFFPGNNGFDETFKITPRPPSSPYCPDPVLCLPSYPSSPRTIPYHYPGLPNSNDGIQKYFLEHGLQTREPFLNIDRFDIERRREAE